jgi:hypothetical protein
MYSAISDEKQNKLKKVFGMIPPKQALVVAALSLERLWRPFVEGISDCAFTEQERREIQRLEEAVLDLVWTHILFEDAQTDCWKNFCELYDQIEELSSEVDLNLMAKPFYCAIVDLACWCLKGNRNEVINRVRPDIVVGPLDLILGCVSTENMQLKEDQSQGSLDKHPSALAEIERIDADIRIAREYPDSIDLISQLRAEYHVLNILQI